MNFGTPVPLLIGIVLIIGAVTLFFLDKLKPGYGRDADKVYSILLLVSGIFLLAHLNMELLASFQQMIMAGVIIALFIENVQNRPPRGERSVDRGDRYSGGYGSSDYGDPGPDPYRPSRPPEPRRNPRANVRAQLDDDAYGYGDRRPALRGRDGGDRPGYNQGSSQGYGQSYDSDPYGPSSYNDSYGPNSRSRVERPGPRRPDERIRAGRSSLQLRGDVGTGYGSDYGSGSGGYSAHSNNNSYGDSSSYGDSAAYRGGSYGSSAYGGEAPYSTRAYREDSEGRDSTPPASGGYGAPSRDPYGEAPRNPEPVADPNRDRRDIPVAEAPYSPDPDAAEDSSESYGSTYRSGGTYSGRYGSEEGWNGRDREDSRGGYSAHGGGLA